MTNTSYMERSQMGMMENLSNRHLLEKHIEQELVSEVKKRKGICPKFTSPGCAGMPDRLVILSDGKIGFVEVKAPGKKPRNLQLSRHRLLRRLGCNVYVLDALDQIPAILDAIEGGDAR